MTFKQAFRLPVLHLLLTVLLALTGACDGNMTAQPKCLPLSQISGFDKGNCARPLPDGVISRDENVDNSVQTSGEINGQPVADFPLPLTQELLERGQDRYTIYCRPCHGAAGYGDGILTQYYFPAPPSFHTDTLRKASPGFIFNVITNGYGQMYKYGPQIPIPDRWAIVAYIKALQISQYTPADKLSESEREQLQP